MVLERLLILGVAAGVLVIALGLWRVCAVRRLARLAACDAPEAVANVVDDGPALLYFTTETCAQCRFQQTPILRQLEASVAIPVRTLDAIEHEQLARHYGILTVPTTVVLDRSRRPVAINHGLAPLHKLREQVELL
jgi:thioredoxin 1